MRFAFDEDQRELRAIVRAFLDRHATPGVVRAAALDGDGFARGPWERLVGEMQLSGLAIDLERGGSGASFVEVGIALEELGRTLLPVPYLPTVVAVALLAGEPGGRPPGAEAGAMLERIAAGAAATHALGRPAALQARGAGGGLLLDGTVAGVTDAAHAEIFVCAAELDGEPIAVLLDRDAAGLEVTPSATLDQTRRQGELRLSGTPATRLGDPGDGDSILSRGRQVESVALALEAVGAASRCLETTVEYLGQRVQFGRPIGTFQALKHRCADLATELEAARSTAYYAGWAVDHSAAELPLLADLARALCNDALLHIAGESIQLHGGIGFTWEHDAHLYFKRAKTTDLLAGGSRTLRRRVGVRAGIIGR